MFYYFQALGRGWGVAVLDNQVEADFIRQAQRGIDDLRSYWISGSTNTTHGTVIDFSSYIIGDTGRIAAFVSMFNKKVDWLTIGIKHSYN